MPHSRGPSRARCTVFCLQKSLPCHFRLKGLRVGARNDTICHPGLDPGSLRDVQKSWFLHSWVFRNGNRLTSLSRMCLTYDRNMPHNFASVSEISYFYPNMRKVNFNIERFWILLGSGGGITLRISAT